MEQQQWSEADRKEQIYEQKSDCEISELKIQREGEVNDLHAELMKGEQHLSEMLQHQMEAIDQQEVQPEEHFKREWVLNSDLFLRNMSEDLSEGHQIELNEMKKTIQVEAEEAKQELERLYFEKDQVEMELKNLEKLYHLGMKKLQTKHEQELLDVTEQSRKKEGMLQQEIEELKDSLEKLKTESEEEIKHLWSQVDGARASRQELSELKEQLLARTSHMEEMECLKKDFQMKWEKKRNEHENELEQLRLYFEQKLKSVGENYREEVTMLHQRLQEMKDSSFLEMENSQDQHVEFGPSMTLLEEMTEKERYGLFEQLAQQLEYYKSGAVSKSQKIKPEYYEMQADLDSHFLLSSYCTNTQEELCSLQLHLDKKHREEMESLRSSLKDQYQESLTEMKMDLSEKYISEIEQLKRKHCLNLEELRAKISEEHLREIAKLHLQSAQDAAREIESKVAERLLVLEKEYQEDLTKALEKQRGLLEEESLKSLNILHGEILLMKEQHENSVHELQDLHTLEVEKEKEKWQQLQKELQKLNSSNQQIEDKIKFMSGEMEGAGGELKNLQQCEEKENRGDDTPISLLRSDIELHRNEREMFEESYHHVLKLLLKMVKTTKDTEDLIYRKTGLCINYSLSSGDSGESQIMTGELIITENSTTVETWHIQKSERVGQGNVLEQTLLEHSFPSLMPDEISEHLCESVFENPDWVFENEGWIHKLCHGLHAAVEKLLGQLAESTRQLAEMDTISIPAEENFKRRNWETCQIVNGHHELMDCLNEENKGNSQLVLELHKTRGLMEGCLAERQVLEEALKLKEESERSLVLELESLKAQVQDLRHELTRSAEEQKLLTSQNKALAANVGDREADLIKEIEHLAKAKLEVQCQAEKDHSTLNAHMKMLEIELEEQLNKNHNLAVTTLEITDLRQQMQVLERQLKNQRDFMDKQAAEREHERDEFQEEIKKLEMELKLAAKFQSSGLSKADLVESLQNEIKERTEENNRLFLDRECMQKELVVRNEEIEKLQAQIGELEGRIEKQANNTNKLTQELKRMKEVEAELQQDKEALQEEKYNNLIQISALHTKLDEARHRVLKEDRLDHVLDEQLHLQEELITKQREIGSLSQQLEQLKEILANKNEEISQLSSQLQLEKNMNVAQIIQLEEENAHLKENIEKLTVESQNPGDSELLSLRFLKSLLEEKNQETDHLNEQILRLEYMIENRKENEILEKQVLEIQDMKSGIDHLHADKEQLLMDKTEEVDQLHKIIEKLQNKLEILEPICCKADDRQDSLNNGAVMQPEENILGGIKKESLVDRGKKDCVSLNASEKQLQGQLKVVVADREALQQLLDEKNAQFKTEVKILEQNLKNVRESSAEHFTKLTSLQSQYEDLQEEHTLLKRCLTQTKTELRIRSAHIQELEDNLQDKQAVLSEKELQLQRVSEQKAKQAEEAQWAKENIVRLENELNNLTQTLYEKEAIYQREIGKLQAAAGELKAQVENKAEELEALRSERDLFHSQLKTYMETGQDKNQKETKLQVGLDLDILDHSEERDEGREEKETISTPSVSAVPSHEDKLDKHLQSMLHIQEENIATKEQQDLQLIFQERRQLSHLPEDTQFIPKMPNSFQNIVIDGIPWDSPEVMRKENSMELWSNLALTPFSEVDSVYGVSSESLCSEQPVVSGEILGFAGWPDAYCNDTEEAAASLVFKSSTTPRPTVSTSEYSDGQENISARNAEDLTLMPPTMQDDLRTTMLNPEGASIDYVSNAGSDLALQLNQENGKVALLQDDSVMAYLQCLEMVPEINETTMKETELFSQQLKNVLDMVYEESYKILVLSEKALPLDCENIQKTMSIEGWQKERLILLDTVQSLKDYLSNAPHKEDRDTASAFFDWRGELLQAVQCVLEKERNMLQSCLQSQRYSPGSGDERSLVEKLQHVMQQQEQQQKVVLEHLVSSDRKSLLTEIQDLEARLRLLHLQSQEKLQQLQEMLINTENRGSKQEHQLRRQVELLEYKLQQEKSIASDLQTSLKTEQEKASEMHELLKQEHAGAFSLKSDLRESKEANERLEKSLQELQKEIVKYSSALEIKEKALTAALQDLEKDKCKEKEFQRMLDEQQHQHKIREDEKSKAIEELQAALELQCIQNNQLSVALEHEQSANSNLRKELQIEHSRCEALLCQEQNKLLELQKNIEVEKNRNLELLSALNHERVLTEQLSMRINECASCKHKDSLQELQAQLYRERCHTRELLSTIEEMRQQVLDSKKEMSGIQMYSEEPQKPQELYVTLGLPNKEQEIQHTLEIQWKKEAQMKKEWEQLQSGVILLRDQENRMQQTRRDGKLERHTAHGKLKEMQNDRESQCGFEVEQWQNTGRLTALHQKLRDMKEQRRYFSEPKNQYKSPPNNYGNVNSTVDTLNLHEEQQKLENIRKQLLSAAAYLSEFANKTLDNKTINGPSSSDETIASLLNILELKAELSASFKPMGGKPDLQNCTRATEYEATKLNFMLENKSTMTSYSLKMQKLYRKYLRAESFRKALVYQKKYLLLLLGGFQECEQATLSLIARMGIYPSPPDLNVSVSRSRFFVKFRSAVRVIIAISRLKFLVKKWHKGNRKGLPSETVSPSSGHCSYPRMRVEPIKQPLPADAILEAGYCNKNELRNCSAKSPRHFHDRSSSSVFQVSSKDPEQSLTEYVTRLEGIQQRLGILMLGQAPQHESP